LKCPNCGSEDISKVINNNTINDTKKGGVDIFWSIIGYWVFGWLGLLLGIDETEETTTKTYKKIGYMCNNCKVKLKKKKK
jgi:predicted RNA-binding Zn-ribbon protein involved in translation (DUF1610 family)